MILCITRDTLARKTISDELIDEVLRRSSDQEGKDWNFTFEDLQVDILKKHEFKVEFFMSRDVPIGEDLRHLFQCSSNS